MLSDRRTPRARTRITRRHGARFTTQVSGQSGALSMQPTLFARKVELAIMTNSCVRAKTDRLCRTQLVS
eukprot:4799085-Pleurochrysis_carterae.AAC.1